MKLIILLSVVSWSSCAKLDRTYLPPSHAQSSGGSNFLQAPASNLARGFGPASDFNLNGAVQNGNGFNQNGFNRFDSGFSGNSFARSERPQAAFERNAAILRQDTQNDGETYSYGYETENGISAEESGVATNGVEAQGGYSYTGDDGQVYTVRYTADQNGFMPIGDHLPTPPPVPAEILKALEQNARDEAAGIYDDGSYSEGKYDDNTQYNGKNYNNFDSGINFNNGNSNRNFGNDEDSVVINSALLRSSDQGPRSFNRANQAYLPPDQAQETQTQRAQANGATTAFLPPVQSLRSRGNGPRAQGNGATTVYLPPVQSVRSRGHSLRPQGNGATTAYLPPVQSQRTRGNGFGPRRSRPSFNARDGYNY